MQLLAGICATLLLAALSYGFPAEPQIKFSTTEAPLDPDHVPSSVCLSMTPVHGGNSPQNGEAPYEITVSKTDVAPGEIIEVTLKGTQGEQYKGLYVQGRVGNNAVGSFLPSDDPAVVVSSCAPGQDNAASYISRLSIGEVTLRWQAPEQAADVTFRSTFVKDFATFWINVDANQKVHVKSS